MNDAAENNIRLSRWEEIPDFGLYLDQVLTFVRKNLPDPDGQGEKLFTSAMVNNYVKMGAISAPVKKKYSREQLALLIVIGLLKSVLPISDIRDYISAEITDEKSALSYNSFCDMYETAHFRAFNESEEKIASGESSLNHALIRAAVLSCAQSSVAGTLLGRLKDKQKQITK